MINPDFESKVFLITGKNGAGEFDLQKCVPSEYHIRAAEKKLSGKGGGD